MEGKIVITMTGVEALQLRHFLAGFALTKSAQEPTGLETRCSYWNPAVARTVEKFALAIGAELKG